MQKCGAVTLKQRIGLALRVAESLGASAEIEPATRVFLVPCETDPRNLLNRVFDNAYGFVIAFALS